MITLLTLILAAYAVTFVVVASSLFSPVRSWVVGNVGWLKIGGHPHMIECRMCTGFWVAVVVCLAANEWDLTLAVYGASYFLATQERK